MTHDMSKSTSTAHLPIYLDYGATTPVDPRVVQAMLVWLGAHFGNPASGSHAWGQEAAEAVEQARAHVADLIGAQPRDIVWTSGATESINLALKGAAQFYQDKGKHLITLKTEHKAVLDTMHELERQGFEVSYLDVQPNGLLDLAQLEAAIRPDTILASVLFVNNEIGVVQDVAAIGALCRAKGVLLHVDAAQATGRVAIDLASLPIDLMSMTAHKTYGPKGVGALYVRRKPLVRLQAQIHGGGHERGMRSGTLPTHQIVGMGEAFRLAKAQMAQDLAHASALQQRLYQGLQGLQGLAQMRINGDQSQHVPQNLSVSFEGIQGEALMQGIQEQLAVSSGSACTSASQEPSHVLLALGLGHALAHSSLRITFGRFTTESEIDQAIASITHTVTRLRHISPLCTLEQTEEAAATTADIALLDIPPRVGSFAADALGLGSAQVGTADSGAIIALQIQVQLDKQTGSEVIAQARFKAFGCPDTIATAAWLAQWLEGKTLEQASALSSTDAVQALALAPVKLHCALLAEDAAKAALDNYRCQRSTTAAQ